MDPLPNATSADEDDTVTDNGVIDGNVLQAGLDNGEDGPESATSLDFGYQGEEELDSSLGPMITKDNTSLISQASTQTLSCAVSGPDAASFHA